MKRTISTILFFIGICVFSSGALSAQDNTLDDVHLFQNYFRDTPIALTPYGEIGSGYGDFDYASLSYVGVQAGFPITEEFEIEFDTDLLYLDPDNFDSETGLSDFMISGRYNIKKFLRFLPEKTKASAGAYITLPVGKKALGEDNTDFGFFGALRHPLKNGTVLTGTVGFDWLESITVLDDRDFSILLGAGVIHPINEKVNLVSELNFQSERDYMLFSGGVDYELRIDERLRAAVGVGLDDGAPDIILMISYSISF